MREKLGLYYSLAKPGVTYGNALTAVAGYLFAAGIAGYDMGSFLALTVGITLVIASACVINNFFDQDIDRLMSRTKSRALVAGKLPGSHAVLMSVALGVLGTALLYIGTNALTVAVALFGWVVYVVLYGMLSKRLSIHGTLVGSVSGAAPIVAGYVAATGSLDLGAWILFAILFFWQMPEFYAIAIYRQKEYAAAKVPVMSVVKGIRSTRIQILIYTILFVVSTLALTLADYAGWVYFVTMTGAGVYWIWLGIIGQTAGDVDAWARKMFRFSLIILLIFCALISLDPLLP